MSEFAYEIFQRDITNFLVKDLTDSRLSGLGINVGDDTIKVTGSDMRI